MTTPFEDWWVSTEFQVKTSLSFKWNIDLSCNFTTDEIVSKLIRYVSSVCDNDETQKIILTIGRHDLGKNENPHIHMAVGCVGFQAVAGEARRRNTFTGLQGEVDISCKVKTILSVEGLECLLKYPWKEKQGVAYRHPPNFVKIPEEIKLYMLESAYAMFQAAQTGEQKRERSNERNRSLLGELETIIKGKSFSNYDDYVKFVSCKFLEPLPVDEYPDFAILKKSIQKLAVKQKIVSYERFFL